MRPALRSFGVRYNIALRAARRTFAEENLLRVRTFATLEELRQVPIASRDSCNATRLIERHGGTRLPPSGRSSPRLIEAAWVNPRSQKPQAVHLPPAETAEGTG
jgi:hypothetical protein